jgi:DNA-directed RNA polymerase beta subunit
MDDILTKSEKIKKIKEFFDKTKLDPSVTQLTLGKEYNHINSDLIKDTATKLIKINKNEVEPDDRDHLLFSKFLGLEDYVNEHINKDAGKVQAKARMKMEQKKNLSWLDAGFFSPQLRSILVSNSLTQNLEGINPLEYLDVAHKVTRMGEGGLSTTDAIPEASREVQDSQFGFIDPMKIPETLAIGVTNYFTHGTRKGFDNKLYKQVLDNKGHPVWVDHETLLKSNVEVPEY